MATYSAGSATLEIGPSLSGFKQKLESELRNVRVEPFRVDVTPDLTGFAQELEARLGQINADIRVDVTPDLTGFAQELEARLAAMNATIKVDVDIDTTAVAAKLEELTRDRRVDIDARLFDAAALARLEILTRDRTVRVGVDIDSSILGNLGNAASRAGSSAAGGLGQIPIAMGAILTLAPLVIGAIGSIGTGLAALGAVAGPSLGAVITGFQGIGEAFTAAAAAEKSAGADAEASAKAQHTAMRAVESAQRQVESAQRGVISAQKSYTDAVRDEKRAQDDVATARKDAKEQLEDLQLTLRGSALNERDAVLGLARARQNLAELGRNGQPVSRLDQDEAILRVQQAEQRLLEVQERGKDLQDKATDANAKGVEQSDLVVAAKDRLTQAQGKVVDASDRIVQANQQVAVSQQALGDAQQALADAQTKSSTTADAFAQAMANLSPAAQGFVLAMRDLNAEGGAWNTFQQSVQEGLFTGLTADVEKLANTLLPAITPAMSNIASSIAGLFGVFTEAMTSEKGVGQLTRFLDSIPQFFDAMAPGIQAMTEGFLAFGDAIAPVAGQLGGAFGEVLGAIGNTFKQLADSGKLTETISGFAQALSGVADLAGPLVNMFVTLGATVGPIMGQFFTDLGRVISEMTPHLDRLAGALGQALIQMFETLAPILPDLVQAFSDLFIAIVPFLPQLFKMGAELLPPLIQRFIEIAPTIANFTDKAIVVMDKMPGVVDALMSLQNPTKAIGDWFRDLAGFVKSHWDDIVGVIKRSVGKIGEIIKSMGDAMPFGTGSSLSALGQSMIRWSTDTTGTPVPAAPPRAPGFIGPVATRADGGILRGPGTGTSDSIPMLASDGEYVVNAAATAQNLQLLEAINNGTILRRADGGIVSSDGLVQFAQGVEGKPYVWGGVNWGDCSGAISALANYVSGRSPFGSRFATATEGSELAARGAKAGVGPAGSLSIGWYNGGPYGGHTAATLPNGVNFEMGGARGNGQYGGGAVGASWSAFTDHAHFPASMFMAPWGNDGIYIGGGGAGQPGNYGAFNPANPYAAGNPGQQYGPDMLGPGYQKSWQDAGSYGGASSDPKLNLQSYGAKAGELGANWLLGALGLENSILSSSNVYNKAYNDTVAATAPKVDAGAFPTTYTAPGNVAADPKLGDPLQTPNGPVLKRAGGGWIAGAGSAISDSIPLLASAGEFVVRADAAASNAAVLEAINAGATITRPNTSYQPAAAVGGSVDRSINYGDVHLTSIDELIERQERAATQRTLAALSSWGG